MNGFTPGSLRAQPGDITTWTGIDLESYEHTLEAANPAYAEAAATGRLVIGRHAEDGQTVIADLATADEVAARIALGSTELLTD